MGIHYKRAFQNYFLPKLFLTNTCHDLFLIVIPMIPCIPTFPFSKVMNSQKGRYTFVIRH